MATLTLDVAQCTAFNEKLTTGDVALIRDVLGQLRGANAKGCLQSIGKSGLGKTVQKLSKHQDVQISQAASAVCAYWKSIIPKKPDAGGVKTEAAAPGCAGMSVFQ